MLIDAHAHLDRYGDDLPGALMEIDELRILTLTNSMDTSSYRANLEIAGRSPLVLPSFGVHPWNAGDYVDRLDELEAPVRESAIIGEIGLDHRFVEDAECYPAQREVFEFFLAAASAQGKLVNLHTSGAEELVLESLVRHGIERAIVHWYAGPLDTLAKLIDRGTYATIGAAVLSSEHVRSIAQKIPDGLLLTETDSPGGSKWLTGEPGRPRLIEEVVRALGEVRGTRPQEIERVVEENLGRLLRDDPRVPARHRALLAGA